MSSPLTTDFKEAVAILIAALSVGSIGLWVFLNPSVAPPQELVTLSTLGVQFLFGIAGTNIAYKAYRAQAEALKSE